MNMPKRAAYLYMMIRVVLASTKRSRIEQEIPLGAKMNKEKLEFWSRQTLREKAALILTDWTTERGNLLEEIKELKEELNISCQALHEYRDNVSYKCEPENIDSRVVAFGEIYTGRRALNALKKMPIACKMRNDRYEKELESLNSTSSSISPTPTPSKGSPLREKSNENI